MKKYLSRFDWLIFFAILFLTLVSLGIVGSVVPELLKQHLTNILIGYVFFFVFSQIDFRLYHRLTPLLFCVSLFLLLLPLVFGSITRGSLRWVQIGPLSLQPSELVKPILILFAASFFSGIGKLNIKLLIRSIFLLLLPIFLVFVQPDLGSSVVILLTLFGIIFAAGIPWKMIGGAIIIVFLLSPLLWHFMAPYQQQRIHTFFDPKADPLGSGYNVIQSIVAVGSGQFSGRGLGKGTQSHLQFLPERHTDFVFASIAEEMGFVGSIIIVASFGMLLARLLAVSLRVKDRFSHFVVIGIFTGIFCQFFINIGMSVGIMPVTGITLPLVSYGGNSVLATMICLGIAENIARTGRVEEIIEIR